MARTFSFWLATTAATSLATSVSSSAFAAIALTALPQAMSTAAIAGAAPCAVTVSPGIGVTQGIRAGSLSKSAAILGGGPSALERMRLQQAASQFSAPVPPGPVKLGSTAPANPLQSVLCDAALTASANPLAKRAMGIANPLGENVFLASPRLAISRTSFDAHWTRVSRQGLTRQEASRLTGIRREPKELTTLERVNAWANRNIRYAEDSNLYGRNDHWAAVRTTLKRRAGDCEDIAIAKMQLLAALGIPRSAMYLTVARDLVRNADHALLVVKIEDRFWLLDNTTDTLLDGNSGHDYRPIYSFGSDGKWLHGYAGSNANPA